MLTRLIRSLMISLALLLPCIAAADTAPMFLGVVGDTQKPDGDPLADFRWGLSQVSELPLDALLMPGDLTDTGTHVQWKGFMAALEGFPHPVVYAAGNHDAVPGPRLYRSLFRRYTGQPAWAHCRIGDWRLLVLDTPCFHGRRLEHNGTVGEVQLRWIERQLAQIGPEEPIMVMAHHPFGEPSDGIENWEEVLAAFEGRRLRFTLTGHFHRNRLYESPDGTPHLTTGALSFSTAPAECGIGYRFLSLIGNDLHTVWVERDDPEARLLPIPGAPRGRLSLAATIALPRVTGGAGALLLTYRGGPIVVTSGTATHYLAATAAWATCAVPLDDVRSVSVVPGGVPAEIRSAQLLVTPTPWETIALR